MLSIFFWTCLLYIKATYGYPIKSSHQPHEFMDGILSQAGLCVFPRDDPSLAPITSVTGQGWLPDSSTPCTVGSYCSFMCTSGHIVNPKFSASNVLKTRDPNIGKVLCESSGIITVSPLCIPRSTNIRIVNSFDSEVSFCERVSSNGDVLLASNKIDAKSYKSLSVTQSSHRSPPSIYYLNPPGTRLTDGCQSGTSLSSKGFWSPYILEMRRSRNNKVLFKLSWNPNYALDYYWSGVDPDWGVIVEGKNRLGRRSSCSIDPTIHKVNECENSKEDSFGCRFCTVEFERNAQVTVSLFSRDNADKMESLIHEIFSEDNRFPGRPELDMLDHKDQPKEKIPEGTNQYQEGSLKQEQEESLKQEQEESLKQERQNSLFKIQDSSDKNDQNPKDNVLTTVSSSSNDTCAEDSKDGHINIIYMEIPGNSDLKVLESKLSSLKTILSSNQSDDPLSNDKELQEGKVQSYLKQIGELCRYIIDKFGTYSHKICTPLKHNNDISSSSNDGTSFDINSDEDIIFQDSSAFKTVEHDIKKLFIIISGITLISIFM